MTSLQKWKATPAVRCFVMTFLTSLRYHSSLAHPDSSDYDGDHDDHSEGPMLTTGQLAGIICGVIAGIIILTIGSLCLLRSCDPIAWNRLLICFRSLSSCTVTGPEHPDEPVKSRDPEDPLAFSEDIEAQLREKAQKENFIEQYQPVPADGPGQDVVDYKENDIYEKS